MLAGLRKAFVISHVAAITTAILLFQVIDGVFLVVLPTASHLLYRAVRSIEMQHDPFFHPPLDTAPSYAMLWSQLMGCVLYFGLSLLVAWALCKWAYGTGPVRALVQLKIRLSSEHLRNRDGRSS